MIPDALWQADAIPVDLAGAAWLAGQDPYVRPEMAHVGPFLSPPPMLPIAGAIAATGHGLLALQLLGVLVSLRALWLLWRGTGADHWSALTVTCAAVPSWDGIQLGQTSPAMTWAIAAVLWAGPVEAGVALAVAGAAKITPLAILPLVLLWRPRAAGVCVGVLLALAALAGDHWELWRAQMEFLSSTSDILHQAQNRPAPTWLAPLLAGAGLRWWRVMDSGQRIALAWLAAYALVPLFWPHYWAAMIVCAAQLAHRGDST